MAECHPVGFQWVMEARERGAEIIHVDPRFTRTSAVAGRARPDPGGDGHRVPRRADQPRPRRASTGSASTSLAYTNAATLDRRRTSWTRRTSTACSAASTRRRRPTTRRRWTYENIGHPRRRPGRARRRAGARRPRAATSRTAAPPERDPTLEHPRCVMQVLRRHFARYTPEMVERVCGIPQEQFRARRRRARAQLGPRAHDRLRLLRRLDAPHDRRPVHPRRLDPAAAAGQHRPARRRHHGAARARVDPGLDGHPDALQHPARLPADAQGRRARHARRLPRATTRRRPASGATRDAYITSPAEGVVGRRGDAENDFALRPPAAAHRRPLDLPDGDGDARRRGRGLLRHGREPDGRLGERQAAPARRWRTSSGWSCATCS